MSYDTDSIENYQKSYDNAGMKKFLIDYVRLNIIVFNGQSLIKSIKFYYLFIRNKAKYLSFQLSLSKKLCCSKAQSKNCLKTLSSNLFNDNFISISLSLNAILHK